MSNKCAASIIKKLANHGLEAVWAHNKGGGFWIRGGKYLSKAQAKKLADSPRKVARDQINKWFREAMENYARISLRNSRSDKKSLASVASETRHHLYKPAYLEEILP